MLYFLALFSLSTSPNWAKLNQMPPEILGFWRLSIAATLIVLWQIFKKDFVWMLPNQKNKWIFISGFFFFLHLWTYKYASKHTLVSNTMVLFTSNPIWASLGGVLFFKEKIKPRVYWAYLIALSGILFLVWSNIQFSPEYTLGNISALISALFFAIYMLTGKKARQSYSNQVFASYQYLTCALCFLIMSTLSEHPLIDGYDPISWLSVIGLVILPTFLGHYLMTHLVSTIDIAVLTCGKLIEPLLASVMAFFIFKESLSSAFFISFSLTVVSVFILFWPQINKYLKQTFS